MQEKLLERLVFFSDAVFAIAITLLVIEIGIPHVMPGDGSELRAIHALAGLSSKLTGFAVGFLVIGAFWTTHHRIFGMVEHYDTSFVWPNLRLLLLIAFLPFATGFMSENSDIAVPNIFYSLCLLAISATQYQLALVLFRPAHRAAHITDEQIRASKRRMLPVPIAAIIAILASPFAHGWAMLAYLLIPLMLRLPGRPFQAK